MAERESQLVHGVVLLGPVLGTGAPPRVAALARIPGSGRLAAPALRTALRLASAGPARAVFTRAGVPDNVVDRYRRPLLEAGVTESLWAMTAAMASRPDDEFAARSRELQVPALVIRGRRDRWSTPLALPNQREMVLEHAGHLPHEDDPQGVAELIAEFATEVTASA